MKKTAMVAVSIGVILVIVGLVMVGIFGGERLKNFSWISIANGFSHDLTKADKCYDFEESEIASLKNIVINSDVYTVYVLPAEDNTLSVKYVNPSDDRFKIDATYNEQTSTLTVTEQNTVKIGDLWFWSNWLDEIRFVAVYLPQTDTNAQASLSVTAKTANIKVDDVALSTLMCEADTGGISVSNCNANVVNLETKTGAASVDKLVCNSLTMETKTGAVNVAETTVEQLVNIDARTGAVNCNVTTNKLVINDNTGSVNFKVKANVIKIETNTGLISGTIIGVKDEYQITVEKDTGHSNITSQKVANATKFLDVEVNTGSIDIKFENN